MAQSSLITVTKAKDVDKKSKTSAGAWPIWDSESHPCDPPGSGKFPFDYSKQEVDGGKWECKRKEKEGKDCDDMYSHVHNTADQI